MPRVLGSIELSENSAEYFAGDGQFKILPCRRFFVRFASQATTGTSTQTLWTDVLAANTLSENGQTLRLLYAGTFAANSNQKKIWLDLFGTAFAGIDTVHSDGAWRIEATVVRVSSSVVRISVFPEEYKEITGLTLTTAQNLKLVARTPDTAGDLTAEMAIGEWLNI